MEGMQELATKVGEGFTALIKNEIKRQGLISNDPPHLYDSIQANVFITEDNFSVSISGYDYFKYLDAKYDILANIKSTAQYQSLIDEVAKFLADKTAKELKEKMQKNIKNN